MLYCNESKKLFHIHIPRTGGRFTKEIFLRNSYDFYFGSYMEYYFGIEIPHLHYPLYMDLEHVEESEHFAVVRNPFEKFKSAMQVTIIVRHYEEEIYEKMKDKDWLFTFLDNEKNHNSYVTNFFRNQIDFVSKKTKIWKIENKLEDNYINWLNDNFNISLKNFKDVNYDREKSEVLPIKKEIDYKIEELIKEYYEEDYDYFGY